MVVWGRWAKPGPNAWESVTFVAGVEYVRLFFTYIIYCYCECSQYRCRSLTPGTQGKPAQSWLAISDGHTNVESIWDVCEHYVLFHVHGLELLECAVLTEPMWRYNVLVLFGQILMGKQMGLSTKGQM